MQLEAVVLFFAHPPAAALNAADHSSEMPVAAGIWAVQHRRPEPSTAPVAVWNRSPELNGLCPGYKGGRKRC